MKREIIHTNKVYSSPNPLSQAVKYGNLVFVSGLLAKDPATEKVVAGGMREQTRQVIENLKNVLDAAGSSLDEILKISVFITDRGKFGEMNEVYRSYFAKDAPARICVEAGMTNDGYLIEMDCIAAVGESVNVSRNPCCERR
jgi:2-iminobutanoate/2-iminopropanoate deaminase